MSHRSIFIPVPKPVLIKQPYCSGGTVYTDWEDQYFAENEDEFVSNINKYGKFVPAPSGPASVAKTLLTTFPRQIIRVKRGFNTLIR